MKLEEVELTLTLPLPQRAVKLKEFLDTHPESKARPRATELLISTHAALGDQKLKNGDTAAGVEQLLRAIDEADVTITDKLFSGVISQIPMNLYLRGERSGVQSGAECRDEVWQPTRNDYSHLPVSISELSAAMKQFASRRAR